MRDRKYIITIIESALNFCREAGWLKQEDIQFLTLELKKRLK